MERVLNIDVEYLPERVYLATSEDIQGLVAQTDTLDELIKLVPELVEMLDEISVDHGWASADRRPITFNFRYSMQMAA